MIILALNDYRIMYLRDHNICLHLGHNLSVEHDYQSMGILWKVTDDSMKVKTAFLSVCESLGYNDEPS